MKSVLIAVFVTVYLLDIFLLFVYGMHTYLMIFLYKKNYSRCQLKKTKMTKYPMVTIQLPVFNEQYVVERLIDSVIAMEYPKSKKEIQVLDDSTDETLEISRRIIQKYQKQGHLITLMHREVRTGHKGGALREGLKKAKGDFVAVFDADFVPSAEFLVATIPYFLKDSKIGMVQTRWGHINSEFSHLTRAQAMGIDGHFIIDQVARAGSNLYMNFNGTAGMWRKKCILDAGNWQDDTLTEDFDLSYRAELKGWKFKYIKDIVSPAELPVQLSAYKSQQFRWANGSIQTGMKLLKKILCARETLPIKLEAVVHLTYYSVHPIMLLNILLTIPALHMSFLFENHVRIFVVATFFALATFGPLFFYGFSQYILYKDWKKKIRWVPLMMILGTGIAVNNTKAFLEAVFGKKTEFVRTPKLGVRLRGEQWKNKKYKVKVNGLAFFEFFFTLYSIYGVLISILYRRYFAIPFLLIYAVSFFYVFFIGLTEEYQLKRVAAVND